MQKKFPSMISARGINDQTQLFPHLQRAVIEETDRSDSNQGSSICKYTSKIIKNNFVQRDDGVTENMMSSYVEKAKNVQAAAPQYYSDKFLTTD